jgi:hypothetical protein
MEGMSQYSTVNFNETFLKINGKASRGFDLFGALKKVHGSGYKNNIFHRRFHFCIVTYTKNGLLPCIDRSRPK